MCWFVLFVCLFSGDGVGLGWVEGGCVHDLWLPKPRHRGRRDGWEGQGGGRKLRGGGGMFAWDGCGGGGERLWRRVWEGGGRCANTHHKPQVRRWKEERPVRCSFVINLLARKKKPTMFFSVGRRGGGEGSGAKSYFNCCCFFSFFSFSCWEREEKGGGRGWKGGGGALLLLSPSQLCAVRLFVAFGKRKFCRGGGGCDGRMACPVSHS